jgi:hypothetical protein
MFLDFFINFVSSYVQYVYESLYAYDTFSSFLINGRTPINFSKKLRRAWRASLMKFGMVMVSCA